MSKIVDSLKGGEIFAIPLFLSDVIDTKNFARENFLDKGNEFAYCRVIRNAAGGRIFIEVFSLIGGLDIDMESIIQSGRLFQPIAITGLGIGKKRWKKLFEQPNYDKEIHSHYSRIQLVEGVGDNLRLVKNGKKTPISRKEASKYERWIAWRASHLEKRILETIS